MGSKNMAVAQRARAVAKKTAKSKVAKKTAKPAAAVAQRVESKKVQAARSKLKIPKKIGAVADLYYVSKQGRLELQHEVDDRKAEETVLKNYLIDNLPKSDSTGAIGKLATARVYTESVAIVDDWETLYKHIKKTGDFDLLNRALNQTAVKERWDNGKAVPGVGSFDCVKVSLNKL